jgi:ATP/ADP translocase
MEVSMRERYIPAFIMLIAGTVTSIINMLQKIELVTGLQRLLLVLIIFYMIGLIAKRIIKKAISTKPSQMEQEETEEDELKEEAPKENT